MFMSKRIQKLIRSETLRYLIFGIMTVLVNTSSYCILSIWLETLVANTIAFFLAVFFAYWTNSRFVFCVSCTWKNFLQFMGMRIGTLFIDDGGMVLLLNWGWNSLFAKCIVNGVIIVLNYVFSKLFIFRKSTEEKEK